ncbi:stress responsive A/B Barrel domain protein [Clostridium argentinense CDC 2741]|uniref:Stress responsive A/B Barrel domain protein n=1 Tax=Clostridium argentinense CDC 2741 TaxID=1418104 RepID=A0A0C1UC35_9CLOT|nr:Dabb family protein [Clostridium argentinense]ARC84056.1 stress responsive protein [Clostridium argentinense]KIE45110.1 stress responsive A/B Barrel domain protein [Clostridium argentinense CDC 2741]NFF39339.1 Dabb family protein [Clostridium argentinense]NFP50457.1 Dabb family protein [Clostridium argentinense]NFP73319.1 Dabb family protein [Clostridium argentinense]
MFTHIVFFKLKETTQKNLQKAKNILLSMEGNIPMLKYLEVGVDELHTERSYDIVLITRFDSVDDMNAYKIHPYHVAQVLAPLKDMIESSKAVDYAQ